MSFVRRKTIHGHDYLYLVENTRHGATTRQRVIRYLGRVDGNTPAATDHDVAKERTFRPPVS